MDKILSGLARFGLDEKLINSIFEEETEKSGGENAAKEVEPPKETDFLLLKSVTCPICDKNFKSPAIKTGKIRRKEPDMDLRPRFEGIDVNKYDVISCPKCGYTGLNRYFGHLAPIQIKLIREGVISHLKSIPAKEMTALETIDYGSAIELYKMALYTSVVKKCKGSEKAYICLKISWLLRGRMEELSVNEEENKEKIEECQKEYDIFYAQAFDGFTKAISSESYPIAGMDQYTMDLLVVAMAYNLGKYEYAARYVSSLIVTKTVPANIKKRAYDLKELILEKIKK